MQYNCFLLLKKLKNTESAQHCLELVFCIENNLFDRKYRKCPALGLCTPVLLTSYITFTLIVISAKIEAIHSYYVPELDTLGTTSK